MNTTTNFRISIPKPCHEDWNKMTPDEKGAFCKVCNKSVHDFTKKEPEEIKTILTEEMSAGKKVCGRFNEDQIEPVQTPPVVSQSLDTWSLNFQRVKKFAIALFLVFGGYLFNSTKSTAQKIMGKLAMPQYHEPVRGEIAISQDPEPAISDTARTVRPVVQPKPPVKCSLPKGDVKVEPVDAKQVLGGVKAMPVEEPVIKGNAVIEQTQGQVAISETPIPVLTGSVAITEEPIGIDDPIDITEDPVIGDSALSVETVIEEQMIVGMIVSLPEIIEPPVLIDPVPSDSIQNIIDGEFAVEESTYVDTTEPTEIKVSTDISAEDLEIRIESYPNPTSSGMITLKYSLKKDGLASISLFDIHGNLAKSLMPIQSLYASSYETKYDVSDLKAGVYFCELLSGNNKTTTRIVISK